MDKTWMKVDRRSLQFDLGFNQFLKVALDNARNPNNIPCPCLKCCNNRFGNIQFIKDHVYFNGIMQNYASWKWRGECSYAARHCLSEGSETVEQIPDLGGNEDVGVLSDEDHEISPDSNEFMQFVEDGDKPLYPGCTKSTKMNGLVQTFNLKAKHGLSDSCYTYILILFHTLLPDGNEVPGSVNLAKKTLSALGMKYEKIDACPNDCILYRDLNVDAKKCPSCNASRWKLAKDGSEKVGVLTKTLWYFPLIPRFRRMFQSTVSAKELTWHARGRKKDGMMRHSADSPTWKMVDTNWPDFGIEPKNLRLALSLDRFNPYGAVSTYGNLSGCVVKGYNACPICVDQTKPYRLKHSKKLVFLRNRRQLPRHHPYRKQASAFDNTVEKDDASTPLTGEETFARVQGMPKASVRQNLDVMHIEKNCCDAILGTLLNIPGKTKDGVAARLDMVDMGIHTNLKPTAGVKRDKLPLASWNLFVDERKIFWKNLFGMRLFTSVYSSKRFAVKWMYPFERYMKVFKGMVHNRTFPEGCIAECYIVEEAVEFLEEHMLLEDATTVANEIRIADNEVPETIRWLAGGPNKEVPTFRGYHVNGVDFNTMERDSKRSVQNSGVFLVVDAMQVGSAKDKRPTTVDMDFYGRIQQIWEVDYYKFRIKDETVYFSN
ncbi:PREDICTED: uncharacterized protein LOC101310170 [Fragaria vesca subsp. vesca]